MPLPAGLLCPTPHRGQGRGPKVAALVLTGTVETTAQVESSEFGCLPHEGLVVWREGLWKEGMKEGVKHPVMLPPGRVPPGQGLLRGQWPE